jgi:hypothetical protein
MVGHDVDRSDQSGSGKLIAVYSTDLGVSECFISKLKVETATCAELSDW